MHSVMLSGFLLTAVAARYQQRDEDADPFQLKRALLRGVPPSLILMFGVVPSISVKLVICAS
jgi:peptidoglycan/LPS O-acetylase OafA/YrhL